MPTPNEFLAELVTDDGLVTGGRFQAIADSDLPRPGPPLVPGGYTLANITVDQWGRVTAASNGLAGLIGPDYGVVYAFGGSIISDSFFVWDVLGQGSLSTPGTLYLATSSGENTALAFYDQVNAVAFSLQAGVNTLTLTTGYTFVASDFKLTASGRLLSNAAFVNVANTFTVAPQTITAAAAADVNLVLKGAASQSGDFGQCKDSSNNVKFRVSKDGYVATGGATINTAWQVTFPTGNQGFGSVDDNGSVLICGASVSGNGATIQCFGNGAAFGNDGKVVLNASASSGGIVVLSINGVDVFRINHSKAVVIQPQADVVSLQIKANGTQTNNLQNWTDSSSNVLAKVTGAGKLYVGNLTAANAAVGGTIFDHFADAGNVGGGEDDLYSDTTAASQLGVNGDKLVAWYVLTFVSSATETRQVRAYFGGTQFFDSTALTFSSTGAATLRVEIVRESSSVVRCAATFVATGLTLQPEAQYTRITGLTLSNTNILKVTGESAGASPANNDIVAKAGSVLYLPAA